MTFKQISILLRAMFKRRRNEKAERYEFEAGIHGIKLTIPRTGEAEKEPAISEDRIDKVQQMVNETMKRKAREASERQFSGG